MPKSGLVVDEIISGLVAPYPTTVWVELTSRCPFDCIFCSRKHERGIGEHMSFSLFQSLMSQLRRPEVIRLNYSGESIHYPHLADAIRSARHTGATTELVSAMASATPDTLKALVDTGLHRLSVSIHTMDPAQFRSIYRFGDLAALTDRLSRLQEYKSARGSRYPDIDFAFVAMQQNLPQLLPLAEYARSFGVDHISVHPVILRGDVPVQFPVELDENGRLRNDFSARLHAEIQDVFRRVPEVTVTVARPQTPRSCTCDGITTCEQNPWNTMHILASGAVVICEVQDRQEMGSLQTQNLLEVWNGPAYQNFRRSYVNGVNPTCIACPWRITRDPHAGEKVLIHGWHPSHDEAVNWSESSAALAVAGSAGAGGICISGLLPPSPAGDDYNELVIRHGAGNGIRTTNTTADILSFEAHLPFQRGNGGTKIIQFETRHRFCPAEQGRGTDLRNLGFALVDVTASCDETRRRSVRRLLNLLKRVEQICQLPKMVRFNIPKLERRAERGVSLIIPARDTPDLLASTLRSAEDARAQVSEPSEIIVVITGAVSSDHADLRRQFPSVRFVSRAVALNYGQAIELGLAHAKYAWTYLLNSDMSLHADALVEVLGLRRPDVFAIGSRIKMQDGSNIETNWTDLRYCENNAAELIERNIDGGLSPRACLYVGGGSGLFRRSLLRHFVKCTRAYAPFYWEDVEWGALAWRYGYRCLFCPVSEALHGYRKTVLLFYTEQEIARIFERNRLLFHLRNLSRLECLEERLLFLDRETWDEIFRPVAVLGTLWARARAFSAPERDAIVHDRWKLLL